MRKRPAYINMRAFFLGAVRNGRVRFYDVGGR